MIKQLRIRSPQAPSISLEDALNKALNVYDKERRHGVPVDLVAVDIGYKNAKSGASMQAIASIGYYGLMQRSKDGMLSVSIDVEKYKFSPNPELKQQLLYNWLRTPQIFATLLDKFPENLPSDAVIKYELIQLGFSPNTAGDVVVNFKESVEFVRYYEQINTAESENNVLETPNFETIMDNTTTKPEQAVSNNSSLQNLDIDRVPIRLEGGRKAFLEIPTPFYEADKKRLIDQINLILTD